MMFKFKLFGYSHPMTDHSFFGGGGAYLFSGPQSIQERKDKVEAGKG